MVMQLFMRPLAGAYGVTLTVVDRFTTVGRPNCAFLRVRQKSARAIH